MRVTHTAIATLLWAAVPAVAFAIDGAETGELEQEDVIFVDDLGSVFKVRTENPGPLHLRASFEWSTADYFRGRFDGVPEDVSDFRYAPSIAGTFELFEDLGPLSQATLTLGTENSLSDEDPLVGVNDLDPWYEQNLFAGVASGLFENFLLSATFTAYTAPNDEDVIGNSFELAFATAYIGTDFVGRMAPQFKVATQTQRQGDGPEGTYFELALRPWAGTLGPGLQVALPIVLATGISDYYGTGVDWAGHLRTGILASLPITPPGMAGGVWSLTGSFNAIIRQDDLVEADPFGNDGNVVLFGSAGLRAIY